MKLIKYLYNVLMIKDLCQIMELLLQLIFIKIVVKNVIRMKIIIMMIMIMKNDNNNNNNKNNNNNNNNDNDNDNENEDDNKVVYILRLLGQFLINIIIFL